MNRLLYWECNQACWDHLKRMTAPGAISMSNVWMNGIEIRIKEDAPEGYHPVYSYTDK